MRMAESRKVARHLERMLESRVLGRGDIVPWSHTWLESQVSPLLAGGLRKSPLLWRVQVFYL